jgi:DNA-binding CsgD family transcriptional regulator
VKHIGSLGKQAVASIANATIFDQVERVGSLGALWALAARYFRENGFKAGSYILLDRASHDQARLIFSYGVPQDLLDTYLAMDGRFCDPLIRVALASGRPQLRTEFRDQHALLPEEEALIAAMCRHRYVARVDETVVLPLYGPHGHVAACRLDATMGRAAVDRLNLNALQMAAQHMHLKALDLRPREIARHQLLSRREVEILLWVAKGKSNSVIAELLGIAASTVDTYLRRIFEKLGVCDRTTAALKGVGLGLIHI